MHLLGNIAIWYSGTISVIVYSALLIFYLIRRRRKCYDIAEEEWEKFVNNACVLLAGYFLHFLPYLFVERTLFLHHYLPAFIFKVLLTAATINHLYYLIGYVFTFVTCKFNSIFYEINIICYPLFQHSSPMEYFIVHSDMWHRRMGSVCRLRV